MTFTVTYRGADGAVRTEAVEAAGRGDCFAQMKARGIVPMGVKEGNFVSRRERRGRRDELGKNGRVERVDRVEAGRAKDGRAEGGSRFVATENGRAARAPSSRDGTGRKLFTVTCYLFAAIAVIAAIALWWLGRGEAQPHQTEKPAKPKAERPQTPQKAGITNAPVPQLREELRGYLANGNGTPRSFGRRLNERTASEMLIYERTRRELEREKSTEVWEEKNAALRRLGLRTIPNPND